MKRFGRTRAVDGASLQVDDGELVALLGPSGSSQTTLLRIIAGFETPDEGAVAIAGHAVAGDGAWVEPEHRRIGMVFQNGALFSSLTVTENVMVPMREHHDLTQALMARLAALKIAFAGLPAEAGLKYPSELSGGMVKRAALARSLALDPDILFLDEPTAGLDPIGAAAFDQLILTLRESLGLTVFLITHDLDTLYTICDRVAVISKKRVLIADTLENVEKFDDPWVQEYFQGPRGRAAEHAAEHAQPVSGRRSAVSGKSTPA